MSAGRASLQRLANDQRTPAALVLILGAVVLTGALGIRYATTPTEGIAHAREFGGLPPTVPLAAPSAAAASIRTNPVPVQIKIPAIRVAANIQAVYVDGSGTLNVPTRTDQTGWWAQGVLPGNVGPAIIDGHVDSFHGPGVFFRAKDLSQGAGIQVVRSDGSVAMFSVDALREVSKDKFPTTMVYGRTTTPQLRLVTCGGVFNTKTGHYLDNVIVFAHMTKMLPAGTSALPAPDSAAQVGAPKPSVSAVPGPSASTVPGPTGRATAKAAPSPTHSSVAPAQSSPAPTPTAKPSTSVRSSTPASKVPSSPTPMKTSSKTSSSPPPGKKGSA